MKPTLTRENGILPAYDIAPLDLSRTALMVSSAGETGPGNAKGNEGMIGLQRAVEPAGEIDAIGLV